jgi:hypothetical protein
MSKFNLFRGIAICLLFAVIFVNNAMSQGTATAAPEEAKEEEKASEAPFEISGYLDGYYLSSFNNAPFPTSFTPENLFLWVWPILSFQKQGKSAL